MDDRGRGSRVSGLPTGRAQPRGCRRRRRHAVGQTLHVTEGVGLVGTRDGTVFRIHAGETVLCPPDEEHWHGAAADTFMSHLAMLEVNPDGSDPTTWLEPLPDDEYRKAD